MQIADEIAKDCDALATCYVEASTAYATAEIRSQNNPDNHRLYTRSMEMWTARNNVWVELLASLNRLDDAGSFHLARKILAGACKRASIAETEATRRELLTLQGAA